MTRVAGVAVSIKIESAAQAADARATLLRDGPILSTLVPLWTVFVLSAVAMIVMGPSTALFVALTRW